MKSVQSEILERSRSDWQDAFDSLLRFASEGPFQKEILHAKDLFFSRLGRAHEVIEDIYEFSSQTFLEWYLFDYVTRSFGKTPAAIFVTLGSDLEIRLKTIERCLFNHWSLFRVKKITESHLVLDDLLYRQERTVFFSKKFPEFQVWKVEKNQIIQARLFPYENGEEYLFTHIWLHPEREDSILEKITKKQSHLWQPHQELMLSCFEAVIRSFGIESQLKVSQASNWFYQELAKRYA